MFQKGPETHLKCKGEDMGQRIQDSNLKLCVEKMIKKFKKPLKNG